MNRKTKIAIAHSGADLGKPGEYTRPQLDLVKQMIREIADRTMGGMQNIVGRGDKVLIKINTVIPIVPNAGFTTDPRMLEALICTNRMDEIELFGPPIAEVKRRFKRQNTVLQGQYPNVNLIMGSTCEAGCRAIVRIQLDQLQADGTLTRLKRPLYVFTGLQFEDKITEVDGDVIVVGDCAKGMKDRFPDAQYWGSCTEYPNCTPIWANRPDVGIAHYVRHLQEVRESGHAVQ